MTSILIGRACLLFAGRTCWHAICSTSALVVGDHKWSNAECDAQMGTQFTVCMKQEYTCLFLKHEQCHSIEAHPDHRLHAGVTFDAGEAF